VGAGNQNDGEPALGTAPGVSERPTSESRAGVEGATAGEEGEPGAEIPSPTDSTRRRFEPEEPSRSSVAGRFSAISMSKEAGKEMFARGLKMGISTRTGWAKRNGPSFESCGMKERRTGLEAEVGKDAFYSGSKLGEWNRKHDQVTMPSLGNHWELITSWGAA